MSTLTNIQIALETHLNTITGSPSIAWPNTEFTPAHGTLFLEPILLPIVNNIENLSYGLIYEGIYQINIYTPVEKGTATLNLWSDRVTDLFISNRKLTGGADTINIQNINRGIVEKDTNSDSVEFYKTNIDISFIVYT